MLVSEATPKPKYIERFIEALERNENDGRMEFIRLLSEAECWDPDQLKVRFPKLDPDNLAYEPKHFDNWEEGILDYVGLLEQVVEFYEMERKFHRASIALLRYYTHQRRSNSRRWNRL